MLRRGPVVALLRASAAPGVEPERLLQVGLSEHGPVGLPEREVALSPPGAAPQAQGRGGRLGVALTGTCYTIEDKIRGEGPTLRR